MKKIFMIINNALQHNYDKWCSLENAGSLLMSPLTENNRGAGALKVLGEFVKKYKHWF